MNQYFLASPAAIGLAIKIAVLIYSYRSFRPVFFRGVLYMFAALNLCEVIAFIAFYNGSLAEPLIRAYYCCMYFGLAYLGLYSLEVSNIKPSKATTAVVLGGTTAMCVFTIFTDLLVAGSKRTEYALGGLDGPYFIVVSAFIFSSIVFTFFILVRSVWKSPSGEQKTKSGFILLALMPLLLSSLVIIIARNIGYHVYSASITPIATTAFMIIILWGEKSHRMYDIRRWLPFSAERRWANRMVELSYLCSLDKVSHRDAVNEFEKQLIELKLERSDYNMKDTAQNLGLNRTSLYSMVKRLGVKQSRSSE